MHHGKRPELQWTGGRVDFLRISVASAFLRPALSSPNRLAQSLAEHSLVRHPDFGRRFTVEIRWEICTALFLEDSKRRELKAYRLKPRSRK